MDKESGWTKEMIAELRTRNRAWRGKYESRDSIRAERVLLRGEIMKGRHGEDDRCKVCVTSYFRGIQKLSYRDDIKESHGSSVCVCECACVCVCMP